VKVDQEHELSSAEKVHRYPEDRFDQDTRCAAAAQDRSAGCELLEERLELSGYELQGALLKLDRCELVEVRQGLAGTACLSCECLCHRG
jgi:hypothetical protein